MSSSTKREDVVDFNRAIGLVLRYGVIVAFAVILVGSTLLFAEGQTGYYPLGGSAAQLFGRHNHFLVGAIPLVEGVASARPYAIIELGLLILLATPMARVFVSIFLFAKERRFVFVLITITVFALLLFSSFVLGPLLRD